MSGDHARLSASAAERWMNCAGSPKLCEGITSAPSPYAAEGTVAHMLASSYLQGKLTDKALQEHLGSTIEADGHRILVDEEMLDGVRMYLGVCHDDYQDGDDCWTELKLSELQKLDPDFGGTADRVRYRPSTRHLRVMDFKYGAGIVVEVDDNKQLKIYALGVLLQLAKSVKTITITIVQPRIEYETGRIRDYNFNAIELLDFAADMVEAAERTRQPDAPLTPGSWCHETFCPARRICPKLQEAETALMAVEFKPMVDYDPNKLSGALHMAPLVETRIKALREFAYHEAMAGRFKPEHGWKLVDKRSTRHWINQADVIEWSQAKAIDPYAPREVKSPAQLEKQLKKPEKEEIKKFIESKSSGQTLVPVTDDRPEVKRLTADDFTTVEGKSSTVANLF